MKNRRPISDRERAVLAFIRQHHARYQYAPSLSEIAQAVGISSSSMVVYYLNRLSGFGYLRRDVGVARSIVLTVAGERAAGNG